MNIKIIDETSYTLAKKKIRINAVLILLATIVYGVSLFLFIYFDNRNLYILFTFFMALISSIYVSFDLFIVKLNIIPLKKYIEIIKKVTNNKNLIKDNIYVIEAFEKEYTIDGITSKKYMVKNNDKEYIIYIPSYSIYYLEKDKNYEITYLDSFIVEFKETNYEE